MSPGMSFLLRPTIKSGLRSGNSEGSGDVHCVPPPRDPCTFWNWYYRLLDSVLEPRR